jgi:phosphate transport system protein
MSARVTFQEAKAQLDQEILRMGVLVEESLGKAIRCLVEQNVELAEKIIAEDEAINNMELEIEDRCIVLIATEQPVASDLRRLVTGMKIVTQLERMGDHSVHIAKGAIRLSREPYMKPLIDLPRMGELCTRMIREALTAFIQCDARKAEEVAKLDEQVDDLHDQVMREVFTYMMENNAHIRQSISLLFVSRFLERFADHVTNICEWIVYNVSGKHAELNQ